MSRFSEYIKRKLGRGTSMSATELIRKAIGDGAGTVMEFAQTVIALLDEAEESWPEPTPFGASPKVVTSRVSGSTRKNIASLLIRTALSKSGLKSVPDWLVNQLIEELVGGMRRQSIEQDLQQQPSPAPELTPDMPPDVEPGTV